MGSLKTSPLVDADIDDNGPVFHLADHIFGDQAGCLPVLVWIAPITTSAVRIDSRITFDAGWK